MTLADFLSSIYPLWSTSEMSPGFRLRSKSLRFIQTKVINFSWYMTLWNRHSVKSFFIIETCDFICKIYTIFKYFLTFISNVVLGFLFIMYQRVESICVPNENFCQVTFSWKGPDVPQAEFLLLTLSAGGVALIIRASIRMRTKCPLVKMPPGEMDLWTWDVPELFITQI